MKIRRITAPDMRQAIRRVREELGADAVILSNKRLDDGVEIVAALDVEASLQQAVKKSSSSTIKSAPASLAWPPAPPVRAVGRLDLWEDEPLDRSAPAPVSSRERADAMSWAHVPTQPEVQPEPSPEQEGEVGRAVSPLNASHEPVADEDLPDPYARDRERAQARLAAASEHPAMPFAEAPPPHSPRVERLEEEVRGLRTLMESQLRVLEWRRYARHHPLQSELMRRLGAMGLAPSLARDVVEEIGDAALGEQGWDLALRALGGRIQVADDDITESGGVFALVGATGVGKTTTVAKLAARFVMRHGRKDIALVSTDNFRIGAYDQLRAYARILDVPLYVAEDAASLARTLDGLSDRRLVLVDTAGMSQRDTRLMEQMRHLRSASSRLQSLLVISASAQRAMTREAVQRFSHLPLAGCVLTKLDEAGQLGDALSSVIEARLPVAWLGMGQRVPEDLAQARAERLVARAVELMQQDLDDEMSEERMSWDWNGAAAHG
ncbi:MAG: flagellar biosynthesis protein FlhF [Pseudomonadota bacterium]